MNRRGVIFDLDGVLVDSEHWWDQIRRDVVARHGGNWRPDSTATMLGMSTPEWSSYLVDQLGVELTADQAAQAVIGEMARRFSEAPPILPGAIDAVRAAARRAPTAIATSAPPRIVQGFVAATGLINAVTFVISSEQVGAGKPDPAVYLAAARGIDVDPSECIAIEDSTNGMRAALSAGMTLVATPNRTFPPDPSVVAQAVAVIAGVVELPALLNRLLADP